jgi:endonuclease-3
MLEILLSTYPDAQCALRFDNPFQLLVATILSAQCTNVQVNRVTPNLFAEYPDAASMAQADPEVLENQVRSTGFYRNKSRNLLDCARMLVDKYQGQVPRTLEELVRLPGVGRKTANVVL